jgi:hypothetical protein
VRYDEYGDGTRHLQMLLPVSSFGESLRRYDNVSAEAFLKDVRSVIRK